MSIIEETPAGTPIPIEILSVVVHEIPSVTYSGIDHDFFVSLRIPPGITSRIAIVIFREILPATRPKIFRAIYPTILPKIIGCIPCILPGKPLAIHRVIVPETPFWNFLKIAQEIPLRISSGIPPGIVPGLFIRKSSRNAYYEFFGNFHKDTFRNILMDFFSGIFQGFVLETHLENA